METTAVLQLLQFVGYAVVATVFIVMIKADVKVIKVQMDGITENLKTLNSLLTKVAVQDNRINSIEDDIRDMKHGKGFINVNGEWMNKGKVG